jgi:hypothetical protein
MIEIKKTGGAGLQYPILQQTTDLSLSDFTQLNTNPLVILPGVPGYYTVICDMAIQYDNFTSSPFYVYYITFRNFLQQQVVFDSTINGDLGCYVLRWFNPWSAGGNTPLAEDYVISADANNGGVLFNKFIVTINYFLLPNLSN